MLSRQWFLSSSPDYLNHHGRLQEPEDLVHHNCLLLNQDRQRILWHFKNGRSFKKIQVQGNLASRGGTPLLEAVLNGVGVVQLSNWMVSDYVKQGRLIVCLQDWDSSLNEESSGEVYAVYPNKKFPDPIIRLLIDYLVEHTHSKTLQRGE